MSTPSSVASFLADVKCSGRHGLVLDIDETLSWTNFYWMQQLCQLFGNPENLQPQEIARKYHLCQNVPYWGKDKYASYKSNNNYLLLNCIYNQH